VFCQRKAEGGGGEKQSWALARVNETCGRHQGYIAAIGQEVIPINEPQPDGAHEEALD
jgi:hypothetical protein